MAQVTIELCNLLKIQTFELFDFDYPIEDISWKSELEAAIIDYFYFHEIGQETPDRFKHVFRSRLKLIMPSYNELFRSKMFVIDPLLTTHLEETLTDTQSENVAGNSTSDTLTNNINDTVFTEYPEHTSVLDDIASNKSQAVSENTQGTTITNNQGTNKVHDYKKVISGYQGINANQLLTEYRKNIVNINQLIINDMKQCFIMIY